MFAAFGLYSVSVYLAAAAVLHPAGIEVKNAFDLAQTLTPVLGPYAGGVFLAGLVGGGLCPPLPPPFWPGVTFWPTSSTGDKTVADHRFKALVLLGCLVSLIGPFIGGSFLVMLVVMLALGLCGTPLILVLLLLLLLNQKGFCRP